MGDKINQYFTKIDGRLQSCEGGLQITSTDGSNSVEIKPRTCKNQTIIKVKANKAQASFFPILSGLDILEQVNAV